MDAVLNPSYVNAIAASLLLATLFSLAYCWLQPKPIPNIPHNPITSIWGDVPDIMSSAKEGKAFTDYIADLINKHGPLCQVMMGRTPIVLVADKSEMERIVLKGKNTDQLKRFNDM
ncbi:hypothetical protein FRC07_003183 [Ceratobasidium sp. 392]|nr:hypothetical protein FRC07_003183 [Ceratobasidium sp. 392]